MVTPSARTPKVSDRIPDFTLLDDQRSPVRLSGLVAKGPVVLIVFRGEWSPACRAQLVEYRDRALAFRQAGAQIVGLSVDEPAVSTFFRTERGLPFPILCDADHSLLESWGLLERTSRGLVGRPATFVLDRGATVRTRSLDTDEKRASAETMLLFIRRGGARGGKPTLAQRAARVAGRLRSWEHQLREGVRALRPGRT